MRFGLFVSAILAGCGVLSTASAANASPPDTDAFRRIAETAVSSGLTPGLSVAVVQGDRVVWQGAFGAADIETHRPVTDDTRFYIASTSKALTGLAAAIVADHGDFSLQDPLSRVLPGAQLPEGLSADSIRVIDLLTHTHGIDGIGPVSLRIAFSGEYTNDELLSLLAAHRPARDGKAFKYSNLGYDLAGIALAPESRGGWREVVARTVLTPLGMTHTTAYRSRLRDEDIAMPHELGPEGFERVRLAKEDANMGPAGGDFTTAGDLARLVVAELNQGRIDGRQVVPARVIHETQILHAVQDRSFDGYHRHGWGIGWDLGTFEADTLLHRFGGFAGYFSHVSFMPEHGVGVVVLVNGGGASTAIGDDVANSIYDRLLGRSDAEARWAASLKNAETERTQERAEEVASLETRQSRQVPLPFPWEAYVGTYYNEQLGTLRLERTATGVEAILGVARSSVEVYDAAANQLRVELFGSGSVLTAVPGSEGMIGGLEMFGRTFARR